MSTAKPKRQRKAQVKTKVTTKRVTWKAELAARAAVVETPKKGRAHQPSLIGKTKQVMLIAELARGSTIGTACDVASVARSSYYRTRDYDSEFAELADYAIEQGTDVLEQAAKARATDGVSRPVYQGGKCVGYVQEYSDTLLIALLNARRPEKFKWRGDLTSDGKEIGKSLAAVIAKAGRVQDRKDNTPAAPRQVTMR